MVDSILEATIRVLVKRGYEGATTIAIVVALGEQHACRYLGCRALFLRFQLWLNTNSNRFSSEREYAMIRPAIPSDTPALVSLSVSTGLFLPHEADALLRNVLDELHAGRLGEGHLAHVWVDGPAGPPAGWVYFSLNAMANQIWDLWWIGVAPLRQGQGIGDKLLQFVEGHARSAGGRVLIIETSSLPKLERTRNFYAKRGYVVCGQVPDFYADGDDKVIFAKRLAERASGAPLA